MLDLILPRPCWPIRHQINLKYGFQAIFQIENLYNGVISVKFMRYCKKQLGHPKGHLF
jgi:hypothetical protein